MGLSFLSSKQKNKVYPEENSDVSSIVSCQELSGVSRQFKVIPANEKDLKVRTISRLERFFSKYLILPSQRAQIKELSSHNLMFSGWFRTRAKNTLSDSTWKQKGIDLRFLEPKASGEQDGSDSQNKLPVVILMDGNAEFFQHHQLPVAAFSQVIRDRKATDYNSLVEFYLKKGCRVVVYNYRNVMGSKALKSSVATRHTLVQDAIDVIRFAIDKAGVNEEDILVHGHSIGAAIASEAVASFTDVSVVNERSFAKLSVTAKELIRVKVPSRMHTIANKLVHFLCKRNWDFHPEQALEKISGRKKSRVYHVYHPDDKMILPNARLPKSAAFTEREVKMNPDFDSAMRGFCGKVDIAHNRFMAVEELEQLWDLISKDRVNRQQEF